MPSTSLLAGAFLGCTACDRTTSLLDPAWGCAGCGELLEVRWGRAQAEPPVRGLGLGEGSTPLVRLARWGARHELGAEVYAKLELANPTGSFKDRGAALLVAVALAAGASRLLEDSSGNAGAAIAAYAARAGLPCTVFAPASAPAGKLRQVSAYGATLVRVEGPRAAVTEAAVAAARADPGAYYASHNRSPVFLEGCVSLAGELAQVFAGEPPDHVVLPVAGGALYLGAWLGFERRRLAGRLARVPRLHLAQPAGCAPLVAAASRGLDDCPPIDARPTVAGGLEIAAPPRGRATLAALRASSGAAVAVTDEAILVAQAELARLEGIHCEPTSAAAFAGLAELARRGIVEPGARVVVAVTGSGLKVG